MNKPKPRRWRLWTCIMGSEAHRAVEAREEIAWLESKGFKAKIWAPRPEHKTSGHTHIVVLCTFEELCGLAGIEYHPDPRVEKESKKLLEHPAFKVDKTT